MAKETEEVKTENIDLDELKRINEQIISDDKKKLQFYEKLRSKLGSKLPKSKDPEKLQLTDFLFALPDFFILLTRLFLDKRVPGNKKVFLGSIIGYMLLPFDLIPDFIPILGYLDDLVLVVLALDQILNDIEERVLIDNWSGKSNVIELIRSLTAMIQAKMKNPAIKTIKEFFNKVTGSKK